MFSSNTQSITYSDFNVGFNVNPITGDLLKVTGVNSVTQALMNLVQINYFEKPFHPEIGSNIRRLLFEPMDPVTSTTLANEIENLIQNFEPRVTVNNIIVQSNYDTNGYNIEIEFEILAINNTFTISTFLQRLR